MFGECKTSILENRQIFYATYILCSSNSRNTEAFWNKNFHNCPAVEVINYKLKNNSSVISSAFGSCLSEIWTLNTWTYTVLSHHKFTMNKTSKTEKSQKYLKVRNDLQTRQEKFKHPNAPSKPWILAKMLEHNTKTFTLQRKIP